MSITTNRAALALALTLLATNALAAPTPEQKCEGGKNKTAGGYAACLGKAESSYLQTGDAGKYGAALVKCQTKYAGSWTKLEGGTCVTTGDSSPIEDFVEACQSAVATALGGGGLPLDVVTCNDDLDTCNNDLGTCNGDLGTCNGDLDTCNDDLTSCDGDLSSCQSDLASNGVPLKRTGEVTCYDSATNTDNVVPCAGTGQDGEIRAGSAPSYTDNGDGTITDNRTKLMWEKLSDNGSIHDKDNTYTLQQAYARAVTLNTSSFAGHNDWRVPNRRELESIIDLGRDNPAIDPVFHTGCVASCNGVSCSCTRNDVYWSSTTYRYYARASWGANFVDGDVYAMYKTDTHRVRLVRTVP